MKKIFLLLMIAIMASCSTTTIVVNERAKMARIKEIIVSPKKEYKYRMTAWQYEPRLKRYTVYTDSLYNIGDWIEIKK